MGAAFWLPSDCIPVFLRELIWHIKASRMLGDCKWPFVWRRYSGPAREKNNRALLLGASHLDSFVSVR
jgi:hypothetical protein